jgi:simple sugar transport system substrate-binding protein
VTVKNSGTPSAPSYCPQNPAAEQFLIAIFILPDLTDRPLVKQSLTAATRLFILRTREVRLKVQRGITKFCSGSSRLLERKASMKKQFWYCSLACLPLSPAQEKMEDITIRFFAGGDAGDPFASIVYRGALAAQKALGVKVDYVFSGWDNEKMVAQLRDAIAARPDGIAMMGHAGDAAIMPLAEEAAKAGIVMIYQNVDVPKVREKFGGAYVGAQLESQGRALAETAIQNFKLKKGDRVIVFGNWGMPGRYIREGASADAFTKAGMIVTKLTITNEQVANTQLLLPVISGAILAQPATKLILYSNSANLGAVPMYMDSLGKKPGQIINIGFDTSPAIVDAFRRGTCS